MQAEILAHRGVAYRNLGALDKSVADLGIAKKLSKNDPLVARMLAWTYRGMGRLAEAEQELGRALTLEPNPQAYLSRCFVRFDMTKFADGLADCVTAHRINPNEDSTFMTALIHHKLGNSAAALAMLEGAIDTPHESARVYELLSRIYDARNQPVRARRIRKQKTKKFPTN